MAGHSPPGFSDRRQNLWLLRCMAGRPCPEDTKHPRPSHYTTIFDCWYDVFWWNAVLVYIRCNGTYTFQKVILLSHQSTEYLPQSLGDNQDIFWANVRRAFVFFLVRSGFCLGTLPWMPFLPSPFLLLNLNWGKRGLQFLRCCLGCLMTSWLSCRCTLGVILVGRALLGRFTTVPSFLHLGIMALTVVSGCG